MKHQTSKYPYTALLAAGLFALSGCVSIAPIEPIKNPPTQFRADNVVEVEFLHPAKVGMRCGERGTKAFGMPVFHAMACGNGKLITMPDPCNTFTGGDFADLLCNELSQPVAVPEAVPEWQALLQPAGFSASPRPVPTPLKPRVKDTLRVEFVHPAAVAQRCKTRGLEVLVSETEGLATCGDAEMMTVPNPCMSLEGGWYPRTLCHEMAHANGWSMNHPGGSFLSDAQAGVDARDVPPPRAVLASLASSAPLRPASESPAYLAFIAAQKPSPTFEAQPAIFAPQADDTSVVFASVTILSDSPVIDLHQAVLDYASANRFSHGASVPPVRLAAIAGNGLALRGRSPLATANFSAPDPAAGLLRVAGSRPHEGAQLQVRPSPVAPRPPAMIWLAMATRDRATGAAAATTRWLASVLPDEPARFETVVAPDAAPAPSAPSPKPVLTRPWREEELPEAAAGV